MAETTVAGPVTLNVIPVEEQIAALPVATSSADMIRNAKDVVNAEFVPSGALSEEEIAKAVAEIDIDDTNSISSFGYAASMEATSVSEQMLQGVRNKDTGDVGDVMNEMMSKIRGLDASELKGGGLFGWLTSQASRAASFLQKYEGVASQIEGMQSHLEGHRVTMKTSVASLDRLYEATEDQFHNLEVYIVAGDRVLAKLNSEDIPAMQALVEGEQDGPDGTPAALLPAKLAELNRARDDMERQVHDLKIVRMITLQNLPQIRLLQDSDKNLIRKIQAIFTSTIPLWKRQMALGIEQAKTAKAAEAVSNVTAATDEMLMKGADQFRDATVAARHAVEASVVGVDAVEHANKQVIATLQEVMDITSEAKQRRASADAALVGMEAALKEAVVTMAASQDSYNADTTAAA